MRIRRVGEAARTASRDVGVAVGADEQLEARRIDLCCKLAKQASSRGMRRPVTMQIVTNGAASMPLRSHAPAVPPRRPSPPLGGCFGGTVTFTRIFGAAGRPTGVRCDTGPPPPGGGWEGRWEA